MRRGHARDSAYRENSLVFQGLPTSHRSGESARRLAPKALDPLLSGAPRLTRVRSCLSAAAPGSAPAGPRAALTPGSDSPLVGRAAPWGALLPDRWPMLERHRRVHESVT